ncbi:CotH kinase family protein [Lacipirellula sp.]|uniref:CotH kinase family protein n=1 Tax=Lacipirellula sp. TaxID=2691419 RepID=UPI003D0BD62B
MLRITEIVASNDESLHDYDGDSSDWVEIFNPGAEAVDLSGMKLTDNANNLSKWTFPAGSSIAGGGFRIVFASSKNMVKPNGEIHTSFNLSADGEYLGLVAADGVTIIDQFAPKFPAQTEDVSYGRGMTALGSSVTLIDAGATAKAWSPTSSVYDATWTSVGFNDAAFNIVGPTGLGYENNPGDAVNYVADIATTVPSGIGSLYVRMAFDLANFSGIHQLKLRMKYDDGFRAYLNGVEIAESNAPDVTRWDSQATAAHDDAQSKLYQEFDVSAAIPQLRLGQNVLAIHALNLAAGSDMLLTPILVGFGAQITSPENIGFFETPTPGYANIAAPTAGFAATPTFSVPHGLYDAAQLVSILSATPGAVIVYTTNGSTPMVNAALVPTNGTFYTGPITITATTTLRAIAFKTGFKPSFIESSTYLFLGDVINQSPLGQIPAGWPASGVNGQEINYGIDPDIVNLYGAQAIKDSLASLPSLSITTDLANLFDPSTGIYVNAYNDGRSWERAASAELLNPDGSEGFAVNAGLRIRGGYSRSGANPKHSLRLYFRSEYGDGKLDYPLFGDEGASEFDVIDLRTDQNYSWSFDGNPLNSFVREVFGRDMQRELGDPYTRSRYYHLYLNGVYWGIYQTQERVEEFYGETYLGGDEADYDVVKSGWNDGLGYQMDAGNDAAFQQLYQLAQNLAVNPTTNANNYYTLQGLNPDGTRNPSLPVLLDADNLINYMLIIFYTGGYDSSLSRFLGDNQANNWFGIYNRTAADEGFQFFIHDNEHSLGAEGQGHSTQNIDRTGPFNNGNQNSLYYFNPTYLHQDLLSHPEYRQRFIEKVQEYFFNGGPMTPQASVALMNQRIAQVEPAIIAEAARWGDSKVAVPYNKSTWQTEINWLRNTYFRSRSSTVLGQLRADGLYVAIPAFSLTSNRVPFGSLLSLASVGGGSIYYTTDGQTDPRLVGGAINPSAAVQPYVSPFALNSDVTIRARFRTSTGAWSPLVEMSYTTYLAGDYTGDSVVDGADFLAWQRTYGDAVTPIGSGADGSQDGVINNIDLDIWKARFGDVAPSATPSSTAAASASAASTPLSEVSPAAVASLLAENETPTLSAAAADEGDSLTVDAAFASLAGWRTESSLPPNAPLLAIRRERWFDAPSRRTHHAFDQAWSPRLRSQHTTSSGLIEELPADELDASAATEVELQEFDAAFDALPAL